MTEEQLREAEERTYEELCQKVEAIDPVAAKWLREQGRQSGIVCWVLEDEDDYDNVITMMTWASTPQGHAFWNCIADQL